MCVSVSVTETWSRVMPHKVEACVTEARKIILLLLISFFLIMQKHLCTNNLYTDVILTIVSFFSIAVSRSYIFFLTIPFFS